MNIFKQRRPLSVSANTVDPDRTVASDQEQQFMAIFCLNIDVSMQTEYGMPYSVCIETPMLRQSIYTV